MRYDQENVASALRIFAAKSHNGLGGATQPLDDMADRVAEVRHRNDEAIAKDVLRRRLESQQVDAVHRRPDRSVFPWCPPGKRVTAILPEWDRECERIIMRFDLAEKDTQDKVVRSVSHAELLLQTNSIFLYDKISPMSQEPLVVVISAASRVRHHFRNGLRLVRGLHRIRGA